MTFLLPKRKLFIVSVFLDKLAEDVVFLIAKLSFQIPRLSVLCNIWDIKRGIVF
jgi:hypothetical protein